MEFWRGVVWVNGFRKTDWWHLRSSIRIQGEEYICIFQSCDLEDTDPASVFRHKHPKVKLTGETSAAVAHTYADMPHCTKGRVPCADMPHCTKGRVPCAIIEQAEPETIHRTYFELERI
jgi:hypothetical protein